MSYEDENSKIGILSSTDHVTLLDCEVQAERYPIKELYGGCVTSRMKEYCIERKNKAKTTFLSHISHEIRTSMNGIIGLLHLLKKSKLDKNQMKWLNMLNESVESLLVIINNLLDISKIEAGRIELENNVFNLKMLSVDIYNELSVLSKAKKLNVQYEFDPSLHHMVIGDKTRLKQILLNLVNNAVKFTDRGSISLHAKLLKMDDYQETVEFIVEDTGIGIAENDKDKIFESFVQGNLTAKKKSMGAGLGLAVSKQLAVLMNGDIYVESTLGKGSAFHVSCRLPKLKKAVKNCEPEGMYQSDIETMASLLPAQTYSGNKIILSVEDNEINQEIIDAAVKNCGFHILNAYSAEEALCLLDKYKVDLILMDIQLPGMNGYDLTRQIRKDARYQNTPIIAMTAYAMEEDRKRCLQSGMNDFISKPIEFDRFYDICNRFLSEKSKIF